MIQTLKTNELTDAKLEDVQQEMRRLMMTGTMALVPRLFDALRSMDDEQFVKHMMQLLKFSLPTYKAMELTGKMSDYFPDYFLQKNGINLRE